jgi:uncharacterized membrane protein
MRRLALSSRPFGVHERRNIRTKAWSKWRRAQGRPNADSGHRTQNSRCGTKGNLQSISLLQPASACQPQAAAPVHIVEAIITDENRRSHSQSGVTCEKAIYRQLGEPKKLNYRILSDRCMQRSPTAPANQFPRWYVISLIAWAGFVSLPFLVLRLILKTPIQTLVLPYAVSLLPPTFALPLIYWSWSFVDRPRTRLCVFSGAAFVLFSGIISALVYSGLKLGLISPETKSDFLWVGAFGVCISTTAAFFMSRRKLKRRSSVQT